MVVVIIVSMVFFLTRSDLMQSKIINHLAVEIITSEFNCCYLAKIETLCIFLERSQNCLSQKVPSYNICFEFATV